ncbi:glycosyltransferase [Zobellella endophytica]|uniref:Glycosyltransferase n=1 Tax=Zobellella endophytica TaxID=2116700 RepID=A0A2P7RCT7_9GAMM|nr:TIGR04282 family arsenosugar biosynthesis glycosyltransferase [Zobellella endophytica]PSJ48003.1 glycosyltransferase [Zobellella endophytica]
MSTRIIVFAKAPLAGQAKTRLIPALGPEGAARLARRMLMSTLTHCRAAELGPVELCASPAPGQPPWAGTALPAHIELSAQGEGDLGARMARAARRGLQQDEQILLIGTDCTHLNPALLRQAAHRLGRCEVMLHPTCDGGYALLGLRRFSPRLFEDIPWSTDKVAALTRQRIRELGWCFYQGECLRDIDEPDDLFWLPSQWVGAAMFAH